jgi:hypothetical protein
MLNYKSVTSSEPQIRSNPALRHINESSGFQKRLSTLLEPTPLPFPTFQRIKESSQTFLEKNEMYAWIRPNHLRVKWLCIAHDLPLLLMDQKDSNKLFSLRIPFDKKKVQHTGPIICEAAWDPQDHILWIWDVIVWEKQLIWGSQNYSKRWNLVKKVIDEILDCGHPMSDAEVCVPKWQTLAELKEIETLDPAYTVEFQPEKAGYRRHVYFIQNDSVKFRPVNHHERKMISEESLTHHKESKQLDVLPTKFVSCAILPDDFPSLEAAAPLVPVAPAAPTAPVVSAAPVAPIVNQKKESKHTEKIQSQTPLEIKEQIARLRKDKLSRVPDTYALESVIDNKSLGLAAIRSLEMSKRLREALKNTDSILVEIQWYEPFQKYEIKQIK